MNLRNNYLLKKLLKWVNKKYKKIKKNTWRYHRFTFIYQKPKWYNLQFLRYKCDRLKMVIMDHFCPFTHPPPPQTREKPEFSKNEKNCWRYPPFTHVYQKPQSYDVRFLRYGVRWQNFCKKGVDQKFWLKRGWLARKGIILKEGGSTPKS